MTAQQTPARRGGWVRRALPLVALGALLVLTSVVTPAPPGEAALDPTSPEPGGTKGLVLILERLGAHVEVLERLPDRDPDTVLVLVDRLSRAAARRVDGVARRGGVVVVADPSGRLSEALTVPDDAMAPILGATLQRGCVQPALSDADTIVTGPSPMFAVPDGAVGCFREDRHAWLVAATLGRGTKVTLGSPSFLTNRLLGEEDNAILAVSLIAPRRGSRVAVVGPAFASAELEPDATLTSLVPRRLRLAVVQLLVAFGVVVLWRLRRLGAPVSESEQVQLPGSELVVAVGNLLQRTGARERAAQLLRDDLRRDLAERLGLAPDSDPRLVADAAADRTRVARSEVAAVLSGDAPPGDAALLDLAQRVEHLRRATLVTQPSGAAGVDSEH